MSAEERTKMQKEMLNLTRFERMTIWRFKRDSLESDTLPLRHRSLVTSLSARADCGT